MSRDNVPTAEILEGSANLKGVPGVTALEEWKQYLPWEWVLKCRLRVDSENTEAVPPETDWYITVADTYPRGDIEFDPAKENGITATFQHQFYNGFRPGELPWRSGRICAKGSLFKLRKDAYVEEPFEADRRLRWNVERTREWLLDASKGTLVELGEPFELPDYRTKSAPYTIAFSESPESVGLWKGRYGEHGVALLGQLRQPKNVSTVLVFNDRDNRPILEIPWNGHLRHSIVRTFIAPWMFLRDVLFVSPWEAPMSWGTLRKFSRQHGIDWNRMLSNLTWPLTWEPLQFMLLGFGIPEEIGGPVHHIHWQALRFPGVKRESETDRATRGVSVFSPMLAEADCEKVVSDKLLWQASENWHATQIFNRGMFTSHLCEARILIIGAGALGAMVAEMLVRGGVTNLTVLDHEKLEIGNLARHTLSLSDIGKTKVSALGARLRNISPHVTVHEIAEKFERLSPQSPGTVGLCDIVLDCTGSDDVAYHLEHFTWSNLPVFCVISVGLQARRLYVLVASRECFPTAFFLRHVEKWLRKDGDEYDGGPLPVSGGIGCWHPAFPARVDDMWLLASTAIKYLEQKLRSDKPGATLAIFEQEWKHGSYRGVSLVREEHDNG